MVSAERLRRYPFFNFMTHAELEEIALITQEIAYPAGHTLFEIGQTCAALYLLLEGEIELHYTVVDEHDPRLRRDFLVGIINPGEVLGISALVEPYTLTASAYLASRCRLLALDAAALRALCDQDKALALGLTQAMLRALAERLHTTRVLLAAATEPLPAIG